MTERSDNRVTFFGQGNFRDYIDFFGIKRKDRLAHMYIIGKTGTGKTTLLETMLRQDIENGEGFALFDPHGDLIERILPMISRFRPDDLVYFNVPDSAQPLAFNPLERVPVERRSLAGSGLLEAFKKIWDDSWGARTEHILRNSLLALLDQPSATLADILRLLNDPTYRTQAMTHVSNHYVREFWLKEADMPEEERQHFYLYLDEFQNFTTLSLANMLSEVRKYKVGMVLAHQYISQVDPEVRDAILGNVGTIISFRIGMLDTRIMAGEFHPIFSAEDLIKLPNYHIYLKLMIDAGCRGRLVRLR